MDEKKRRRANTGENPTPAFGETSPRGGSERAAGGVVPYRQVGLERVDGGFGPYSMQREGLRGPLPGMPAPGPGEEIPIDMGERAGSREGRIATTATRSLARNDAEQKLPIGEEELEEFSRILQKYKTGKQHLERRVIAAENWWKLHNSYEEERETLPREGYKSRSAWLHNVITSKHADAMEAYPEPNILPREESDRDEARELSAILPCILEQNGFEKVYNDTMYRKLKTGTGVYKVVWDPDKLNGLGDISIQSCDLLNLFWEPGVDDIQKSAYFFHTSLADSKELESQYPQLKGKSKGAFRATEYLWDDTQDTVNKTTVIDVYYHRRESGRRVLHYCKYVGDVVLYSTENEEAKAGETTIPAFGGISPRGGSGRAAEDVGPYSKGGDGFGMPEHRGIYDHGKYPFVFDVLFPVEGSPCGYGFVDLCANPQTAIDLMRGAIVKNTVAGATPRYFQRQDGAINEEEFRDITNEIIHVTGSLDEKSIKVVDFKPLSGNHLNATNLIIQELRETSGNTETATGSTSAGVTAASAIAALQEASGKGSRDSTKGSYRAYGGVIELCIELVRQFYDMPRKFRITGENGSMQFTTYDNSGLRPVPQGMIGGVAMGYRMPVFDVKVEAQKKNAYTRMSQNELTLQLFNAGFMNPQLAEQALICLDMMEFEGKERLIQKIQQQATMVQRLQAAVQLAMGLAERYAPEMLPMIAQQLGLDPATMGAGAPGMGAGAGRIATAPAEPRNDRSTENGQREHGLVTRARQRAQEASQPGGGV